MKIMDDEIRVDLGDDDRLIISSRGIIINKIINLARRWAQKSSIHGSTILVGTLTYQRVGIG